MKPANNIVNKIIFVLGFFFSIQWITTSMLAPLSPRLTSHTLYKRVEKLDKNIFISVTI